MSKLLIILLILFNSDCITAQFSISGYIDLDEWEKDVYLSIVDDYRKLNGIYPDQIICKVQADDSGYFEITGDQLENQNRIYRIHVDNCKNSNNSSLHFGGICKNSKEILFIAGNKDTVSLPFSFDNQMFCEIKSTNKSALAIFKIDSLKADMRFAYSEFNSEANRKLNNKKWFNTFRDFGMDSGDPLVELYTYAFISDRSSSFHSLYLNDLVTNPFYYQLALKLNNHYPEANFTTQFNAELNADKNLANQYEENKPNNWLNLLYIILFLSLLGNFLFWYFSKRKKKTVTQDLKAQLTKQELSIFNLILEDKSNKEIAGALFISLSTVKTHVNSIYKKMNVQSRDEAKALFNK